MTATALEDSLAGICGDDALRAATDADRVGSHLPRLVVEPGTEAEVAAVLRACTEAGARLVARGSGSALDWGPPVTACHAVLSTRRLDRLLEHEPGDLVCVAQAGMSLGALRDRLAAAPGHRQALMLDPPGGDRCSLGGVVARNAAGSLRTGYGTPRDLLLGVRFVLADGTVGHAGGKVVKNVAGYDLGRLLTGSLGTLAVITAAAFRLHPVPAASATVVLEGASATRLGDACERLRSLDAVATVLDMHWPDSLLVVRVEGTAAGVAAQAAEVARAVGGRHLDAAEADDLRARLAPRPWDGDGAVAGIGIPRSRVAALLERLSDLAVAAVVRPGAAAAEARCLLDAGVVSALRDAVERLGGHLVLRRGGADLRAAVSPPRLDLVAGDLAAAVKRHLDPAGTLSPGRLGIPG